MKKSFLAMLLIGQIAGIASVCGQNIAINGTGSLPDTSAMLDVSSNIKGFLAPRMTTSQQSASAGRTHPPRRESRMDGIGRRLERFAQTG